MFVVLVFTYNSLWEGMDPALSLEKNTQNQTTKHMEKWKTFTSIALLKTLLLPGLSYICSRRWILRLYIARCQDWVLPGTDVLWGLFSATLGKNSHSVPREGLPQGAHEGDEEGIQSGLRCASSIHFSFSGHVSALSQPRKHAHEPACKYLPRISNISACYPASG